MKSLSECKVLIVDDTEENIDILIEALGNEYDISVATDGETALESLNEEIPDIILLDIIMPDMDGYEVCRCIKENKEFSKVPIIFLTAMTDIDSRSKGFELGAADYITKPFDIFEIKNKVNNHLYLNI
jgi:DNA-binding response OmpR family regulator